MKQKLAFFQPKGKVTNVCADQACVSTPSDELGY
jgi:hypothetical protein